MYESTLKMNLEMNLVQIKINIHFIMKYIFLLDSEVAIYNLI
jgi:hypothetical protein